MGFKPCPLGFKDNKLELAAGQADFNGRVSHYKSSIEAAGDDPFTRQKSA
jgi:hypothetical protein